MSPPETDGPPKGPITNGQILFVTCSSAALGAISHGTSEIAIKLMAQKGRSGKALALGTHFLSGIVFAGAAALLGKAALTSHTDRIEREAGSATWER
jgi:hypothetical protein